VGRVPLLGFVLLLLVLLLGKRHNTPLRGATL
jgi:hypothetical protein